MTLPDPLAGLTMPLGDPTSLGGIVAQLNSWTTGLGNAATTHRQLVSSVVGSSWIGPAATRSGVSINAMAKAGAYLGDAAEGAGGALRTCAANWGQAKDDWTVAQRLAAEAVADEAAHQRAGVAALYALSAPVGLVELAHFQAQANGTDGYVSSYRAPATAKGNSAVGDATKAIAAATTAIGEVTAAVAVLGPDPASYYADNLDATIGEINDLPVSVRMGFVKDFEVHWDGYFNARSDWTNIEGVLDFFIKDGQGKPDDWVSWVDATILFGFERGAAAAAGFPTLPSDGKDSAGITSWKKYLLYMQANAGTSYFSLPTSYALWAAGEEASTKVGYKIAKANGANESIPDYVFANLAAEGYRQSMLHLREVDKVANSMVPGSSGIINWLLNPQKYAPTYYGGLAAYAVGQEAEGTYQFGKGFFTSNPGEMWTGTKNLAKGGLGIAKATGGAAKDAVKHLWHDLP